MSKSTGTEKGILTWLRSQKGETTSTFELHAKTMEGTELVGMWDLATVATNLEEWAANVCETASSDADGRGQTTSYALRHMRDDKVRGSTNLKRVVVDDSANKESAFDGTSAGLASKFLTALERAHGQVIESQKASLEAMKASQSLLSQSFTMIAQLQVHNVQLHNANLELGTSAATPEKGKPDVFRTMLEVVGPEVAAKAVEKFMPLLLKGMTDEPEKPATKSAEQPS